jgi:phosphohistidine phosphatase SixA
MRIVFFLLIVICLSACTSTIYIVRHAEKSTEPKNNPHLTIQGEQRAEALKILLQKKKIKKIFSTNTNRTKETALPISNFVKVPIELYNNDTTINFYKRIFLMKKNTLVIGHSNTVIKMLDSLGLKPKKNIIADNEYDNIFIIKMKRFCKKCTEPFVASIKENKYGIVSIIDSTANKMK